MEASEADALPADFGRRLQRARAHALLSRRKLEAEMAMQMGGSKSTIKKYETRTPPKPPFREPFITRVSEVTGVPVAYFWGNDEAWPIGAVKASPPPETQLDRVEARLARLESSQKEIIGLLTNVPDARASIADTVGQVMEEVLIRQGEKVGLRGKRPRQRPPDKEPQPAA